MIEDGLREVSCGYNAEYEQAEPGKAEQVDITGTMWLLSPKAEPEIVVQLETETQWQIKRKAGGPACARPSKQVTRTP